MSTCEALAANASLGVAPALRAVDCLANQAAASAFGRLFGSEGALVPALTILLTLYIAFFAISLLTGRSRVGISALTPRMITLGLVLTFATSWVAYQGVVWNLAVGAPDQIAAVLMGTRGSATQLFADRIDLIFAAIAEAATESGQSAQGAGAGVTSGSFTPVNVMWLGALLLLLGTVGVLVTARIALAVLLALGPVFVVLGLFSGTRGLTAGWLRGVVLTAITPLFVVLGGGLMLELLVPVVAGLRNGEVVDGRAALALFLIACVHFALMAMVLRVIGAMVAGWSVFGLAAGREERGDSRSAPGDQAQPTAIQLAPLELATSTAPRRTAGLVSAVVAANDVTAAPSATGGVSTRTSRTVIAQPGVAQPASPPRQGQRARGIGSRFRSKSTPAQGMIR